MMTSRLLWSSVLAVCLAATSARSSTAAPVVRWEFGAEEETPLVAHGNVQRDVPGPRPPAFPDFDATNTAAKFDGGESFFSFADPGAKSPFDFTNGDEITLEAWVRVDDVRDGENLYILGKGRTGAAEFARDNQNWALRLRGVKDRACVNFLFATPPKSGVSRSDAHWHRWTSDEGFAPKTGWHHVAVTYRFGDPTSIRGRLDGKALAGRWDMGGPTTEAPVVDDDAVWIGSSQGGRNSFRGALDEVALHRGILDDKTLAGRFKRVGEPAAAKPAPETMPALTDLPPARVVVTLHEAMPSHERWLLDDETWPAVTTRLETDEFLLPRLPLRYDAWGIRDAWKAPVLVRMAADVRLPAGRNVVLVRARGLSRLWIDGRAVARTEPIKGSPSGEEPITPPAEPPLPGLHRAGHRLQEAIVEVDVGPSGRARVVLEALAGGDKFRAEPGELTVAARSPDGRTYHLLRAEGSTLPPLPMSEQRMRQALVDVEAQLQAFDDRARRTAAASRDRFWRRRHAAAQAWAEAHPAPAVPVVKPQPANPIDAFLRSKVERVQAAAAGVSVDEAKRFHATVLPILRDQCFRCHGDKVQGGLRLDSRATAVKAGDSERPAIVPGNAAASELLVRIRAGEDERMPPTGPGLTAEQIATLTKWIDAGAAWPVLPPTPEQTRFAPFVDDAAFLRRAYLDTVGVPPTEAEVRAFLADRATDKRSTLIDRLLADERYADHWMGYWQDVLAENPTMINATLNSTGPFRWFLYDALRDGKPLDRLVTELILLRGGPHDGGSAGFGLAAQNDAPYAAKGHIIASAFLGLELQCARCHDSPYHSTTQRDLYSLAAMFERKSTTVPKTSSVPAAFFEKKMRESLIQVTLKLGEPIAPKWPFAEVTGVAEESLPAELLENPHDSRERLAALVTAPANVRFAEVAVNRVWRRLMGAGFVEPVHDWEGRTPSHPELLRLLAHDFVAGGYDVRLLVRRIMTSDAYRREAVGRNLEADADRRFFNAPERRRLSAEQVVDSFFAAAGRPIEVEELTLDPDGRRPASNRNTFGRVRRAWMLVSLSNERDRPSLNLPLAAAVAEVMETFGWSAARQTPRTDRETAPNVLQPGALANSALTTWLTRAADGSSLADLAVEASTPEQLTDSIFLRFFGRFPTAAEHAVFVPALAEGFAERIVPAAERRPAEVWPLLPRVTWSNHLRSEANVIQQEWERRARQGPPADPRLRAAWREAYEDFVWSVVNQREFVWMP